MELEKLCRCCLSQGVHKDLHSAYIWFDKKEIYAEMLQECFSIVLCNSPSLSNCICDECVTLLRSSWTFRQSILLAEEDLMKKAKELKEEKPFEVKLEPKQDSDGDDSDDYFLADTVREVSIDKIKIELNSVPVKKKRGEKRSKSIKKNKAESWRTEDVKNLVARFANKHKITIKKIKDINPPKIYPDKDIDRQVQFKWASKCHVDKTKHRSNLQAILEYSNVVPFKNKSLLGYICAYCQATFPDPSDLRTHTEADHKKARLDVKTRLDMTECNVKVDVTDLMCTLCDENIDSLTSLKEHLTKIHNKTIYNDIKDHIIQYKLKKGDVYDCAMCSATYETFKMLQQHMNVHYGNYSCSKCDRSFATKRSLNAHRTTHLDGNFKCDHCDKIFASRPKKAYHEKTKHFGTRNIKNCPYCNEPFRSYYQRNQHLIKVHNAEAQYKCNVCNKTYVMKSLLMYHIKKNHLMERNCQCTECGYRFFSKKALKAHMVKHTGERNYQCEVCHKSYARKYTLREHMRIHNNDRRFKCEVCAMSFVQKCSLKSHLLSNHGISMAASDITSVCETEICKD